MPRLSELGTTRLSDLQPLKEEDFPGFEERKRLSDVPELGSGGLLSGESKIKIAKIAPVLLTTTDPREIGNILSSEFKTIGITEEPGDRLFATNNKTGARVEINKPELSKLDIMQGLGIGSIYYPAGLAGSIPKAAATALGTETAIQAGQAAVGGEFNPGEVALSAFIGAGGKAAEKLISAGSRLRQPIPQESKQVIDAGKSLDVPVLTSDVLPPKTWFGRFMQATTEKIPVVGTGGIREGQLAAREGAIKTYFNQVDAVPKHTEIVASLNSQKNKIKAAAGKRYNQIIEQMDVVGDMPIPNTIKAIDDELESLTRPGVITDDAATRELLNLKETLLQAPQKFSMMRENRTNFRDVVNAADSPQRSQMPSFTKAKLEGIMRSMTKDMDDFVASNSDRIMYGKYKQADAIYSNQAQKLTKTRLKGVLDKGEYTPENVDLLLLSNKPSENKILYNSLSEKGKSAARSSLIAKALKDAGGLDDLSPVKFANALKRYENQTGAFFKGTDKQQLEGLKKLLFATKRAGEAPIVPPTGVQLVGVAGLGAAIHDFGTTLAAGVTAGGLARVYESAPVRNALLKIANTPAGTTQFKRIAQELAPILISAAQVGRAEAQ